MAHEKQSWIENVPPECIAKVRDSYSHLVQHIELLLFTLRDHTRLKADVFVLPVATHKDIGQKDYEWPVKHVEGVVAKNLALDHYLDHRLAIEQVGVMPKRLPGVLRVFTFDNELQTEIFERIGVINLLKDAMGSLIQSYNKSPDAQFELVKQAIPNAVRKSILRHIHCYDGDKIKGVSFTVNRRTSMSKVQPRDFWLEKLKRSRVSVSKQLDNQSWLNQIDIEEKQLNQFSPDALFRIKRPLRKAPTVNIRYEDGQHTTAVAHSPVIIFNRDVKVRPFKSIKWHEKAVENPPEPVIPRWHLYELSSLS